MEKIEMGKFIDLTGIKFDKLTVIERTEKPRNNKSKHIFWKCYCECGNNSFIVSGDRLKNKTVKSCGCISVAQELVGQRFGRLLVIKRVEKEGYRRGRPVFWLCQCDCTGKEIVTRTNNLTSGQTKSCGCSWLTHTSKIKKEWGISAFNIVFRHYKQSARKKKLLFELSKDIFKNLTQQKCHYCGREPSQICKSACNNGDFIYNGIDRKNSSLGYIENNIIPCCWDCNRSKGTLSYDEFMIWISRVYNYSKENNRFNLLV
jgi:hypothetical protein